MPIASSKAPSVITSSVKQCQIDVEPDDMWKDALKKRIEEGLKSMVDDATKARDDQLARIPPNSPQREGIWQDHENAMKTIVSLARDEFQLELERERQERRWSNGQAMTPQWDHALKSEQQEIMDRIKETQKESSSPVTSKGLDELRSVERSHVGEDQPASRKETTNETQPVPESRPAPSKGTTERRSASDRLPANDVRSAAEVVPQVSHAAAARPTPPSRPAEVRAHADVRPPAFGNPERSAAGVRPAAEAKPVPQVANAAAARPTPASRPAETRPTAETKPVPQVAHAAAAQPTPAPRPAETRPTAETKPVPQAPHTVAARPTAPSRLAETRAPATRPADIRPSVVGNPERPPAEIRPMAEANPVPQVAHAAAARPTPPPRPVDIRPSVFGNPERSAAEVRPTTEAKPVLQAPHTPAAWPTPPPRPAEARAPETRPVDTRSSVLGNPERSAAEVRPIAEARLVPQVAHAAATRPTPPSRPAETRSTDIRSPVFGNPERSAAEVRPTTEAKPVLQAPYTPSTRPTPPPRPAEARAPETRPVDIRPPVFGNPEVLPRELPPGLSEKAERVFGFEREREHERYSPSGNVTLGRRGSNAQKDEYTRSPSIPPRAVPYHGVPERIDPINLTSTSTENSDFEEEGAPRPPRRRASLRKPSFHERPPDVSVISRPIERPSRPSSEKYTTRSPPKPIPQFWMPPKSPEDETTTIRSQTGLVRRGSSASMRSNGSGGVRPSIDEAIPERVDAEAEIVERDTRWTEHTDQGWTPNSTTWERGKQGPPSRSEGYSTAPDRYHDEPSSYSNPRTPGGGHRSDVLGPPPLNTSTRPVGRKASLLSLEDRDQSVYPPNARVRSKPSFSDDRGYPTAAYHRVSSRATSDDREHYGDHPRPYPTPPISTREYAPYFSAYDTRTDSPYQSEQRSATWRAAMQPPESPPKRRPSVVRGHSFAEYSSYGPPEGLSIL